MTDTNQDFDSRTERSRNAIPERSGDEQTRRTLLVGTGALVAGSLAGPRSVRAAPGTQSPLEPPGVRERAVKNADDYDVSLDGIEAVIDEEMKEVIDDGDVVGATVAVVHDGESVLTKGYGQNDPESGEPIDESTPFRIASVTKPVVWTAVMQLIEAGEVDPHEDVGTYLDSVNIPETIDEPITLAHLATHTAGFEERNQGVWVDDPEDRRALVEVLDTEQPSRVRAPGTVSSYSNYGTALAAQIVADVTGQEIESYLQEHVFDPLEMHNASVAQPSDPPATQGYTAALGSPSAAPGLAIELWPAGSMTASATDMARFMRAHLADPETGDRGLSTGVVSRMREQWFTHHPALDGLGFGWIEDTSRGVRTLWHNGAIPGSFYSHLVLVPGADLGLFVAYNTDVGAGAAGSLVDAFLEASVGQEAPADRESDGPPSRADELAGTFRSVRVAENSHSKLFTTLQAGRIAVEIDGDSLLTEMGGSTTRWVEREPLVFDQVDGHETLAFSDDLSHLFVGSQAFERPPRSESLAYHGVLGAGAALGMVGGIVGPPVASGIRRLRSNDSSNSIDPESEAEARGDGHEEATRNRSGSGSTTDDSDSSEASSGFSARVSRLLTSPRIARRIMIAAAGSVVVFAVSVVTGIIVNPTLLSQPPLWYQLVLLLPPIATLLIVISIGSAGLTWRAGLWSRRSSTVYTVLTVSTAIACWLLYYWNFFATTG